MQAEQSLPSQHHRQHIYVVVGVAKLNSLLYCRIVFSAHVVRDGGGRPDDLSVLRYL